MIRFHDVSKTYLAGGRRTPILESSNACFETGGNYAIMGASGSGKSSVIRLLSGIDTPTSGKIERDELVSWQLGFHGGFNGMMTGRENVVFVARIYGMDPEEILSNAAGFSEIGRNINQPVHSYSQSMKQKLAYGLSLAMRFDTYLIDDLVVVGDPAFRKKCTQALKEKSTSARFIMATHSEKAIRTLCERGFLLHGGKLYEYETLDGLLSDYRKFG